MKSTPKKLTPRQLKAMDLLLQGKSMQEIAQEIGVVRQTISQWKNQDPQFRAQLEELREEAEQELSFALPMHDGFMLGQLRALAEEGPPEHRLKAIQYYFERFARPSADADASHPLLRAADQPVRDVLDQIYRRERS